MQSWVIEFFDILNGRNETAVVKAWEWWMAIEKFRLSVTKAYPRVVPIMGIRGDGSIGGG